MKILIIEDEKPAADRLIELIHSVKSEANVIGVLQSVEESVNWFNTNRLPDLVFMDIQLEDGISFEIFENVNLDVPVIFTTAYNEYTLKAFKVNSIDYLLKPINTDELKQAINKFVRINKTDSNLELQIKQAFQNLNKSFRNRFLIKVGSNYKSIAVNDINHFYIENKGTFVQTFASRSYAIDFTIDQLMDMLDPEKFYRINRSCVVNIDAITQLSAYSSSRLQLSLENQEKSELFVVSRDRVTDFKRWMDK